MAVVAVASVAAVALQPTRCRVAAAAGALPCPLYIVPADYDEAASDHLR